MGNRIHGDRMYAAGKSYQTYVAKFTQLAATKKKTASAVFFLCQLILFCLIEKFLRNFDSKLFCKILVNSYGKICFVEVLDRH